MAKKALFYSVVLIGGFLLLNHATSAGTLLVDSTNGASNLAKTFQGR